MACPYTVFISTIVIQVAYYGEPSVAPALFLKAYLESTTEKDRLSEDAPKIDAKNPAGWLLDISFKVPTALLGLLWKAMQAYFSERAHFDGARTILDSNLERGLGRKGKAF